MAHSCTLPTFIHNFLSIGYQIMWAQLKDNSAVYATTKGGGGKKSLQKWKGG